MTANTSPIYPIAPINQWGATVLATANTAKDGTGTVLTVYTASATDGDAVDEIRFRAAGTNIATVARVFLNNGASNATPANNILIGELTLPATTLSETAAQPDYVLPLNKKIAAGYKLNVTLGTTVAAGYYVSAFGGKYS